MTAAAGCGGGGGSGGATPDAAVDAQLGLDRIVDVQVNEAGNACSTPVGPGKVHNETEITTSVNWTESDSPHVVKNMITVGGTALAILSIDPCAVVRFEAGAGLAVAPAGKRGGLSILPPSRFSGVVLTGTSATPGHWQGISFGPGNNVDDDSASSVLHHTTIEYAGGPSGRAGGADATIYVEGTGRASSSLKVGVNNVAIRYSGRYGIYTTNGGHIKAAEAGGLLEITKGEYRAARLEAGFFSALPAGIYTGNKEEGIELKGADPICVCNDPGQGEMRCGYGLCVNTAGNWGARRVPYYVSGIIHVGRTTSPTELPMTLTVIAPATFRMAPDSGFEVGVDTKQIAGLVLAGDGSNPIVLTTDEAASPPMSPPPAAPGYWRGILFGPYSDWSGQGSRVLHTRIEGAGKPIGRDVSKTCGMAAIMGNQGAIVFNHDNPKDATLPELCSSSPGAPRCLDPSRYNNIRNTAITRSSGHAIVRGWAAGASDMNPDFTAAALNNKFEEIAGCDQTNPQINGTCSPCAKGPPP